MKKTVGFKSTTKMAFSSIIGQLITYSMMPILSRIFDAHAFSLYADFFAWVVPLSILISLRIEYAIPAHSDKNNQLSTAFDAIVISVINTIILSIPFTAYALFIKTEVWYYALIPLASLLNTIPQILFFLVTKQQKTNQAGLYRVANSLSNQVISIFFGLLLKDVLGLILGFILGQMIGVIILSFGHIQNILQQKRKYTFREWVNQYKAFIFFNTPMGVIEVMQISAVIGLIGFYYGDPLPGYFYLVWRVLQAPINLISNNVYLVQYHHCSELKNQQLSYDHLVRNQFFLLLIFAFLFAITILFFGEAIFSVFLGDQYQQAGIIAKYVIVIFAMQFAVNPFSFVAILEKKQSTLLLRFALQFLIHSASFIILASALVRFENTLLIYSIVGAFFHILNFLWYHNLAKNGK